MSLSWSFRSGCVTKEIIVEVKAAEKPKEMAICNLDLKFIEGEFSGKFETEFMRNDGNKNIVIGECDTELDRQIEKCLRTMSCGDKCLLIMTVDDITSLKVSIELINFTNVLDVFELSLEKKLEIAKLHKLKGVELFKRGRDLDSFLRFSKAAKLMITLLDMENNEEVKLLYTTVCNNMSWCHLKRGNFAESLTLSNKVLAVSPKNVKALLRRADAYCKLDDTESAVNDLKLVRKLEPANNFAKEKLIVLQHKLNAENVKYVNVVKKMFR